MCKKGERRRVEGRMEKSKRKREERRVGAHIHAYMYIPPPPHTHTPPTHTSAITKFVSNTTEFPSLMAFREAGPVRYPPPCGLSSWGMASTACQPSNPAGRSGRASHTSFHTWKFLAVGGREGSLIWKKPQPNLMKFV